VTGGGASVADKSGATWLVDSYPNGKTGWAADVENNGTAPTTATVTAICAPAAATAP
jgi:hypothetical protein